MDGNEAHALRQMIRDQAKRLDSIREKAQIARCALLDHDLELVRYLLKQIEETSSHLTHVPISTQAAAQALHESPEKLRAYDVSTRRG